MKENIYISQNECNIHLSPRYDSMRNAGLPNSKSAIVFIDANNWYHNTKKIISPSQVDITKMANFLCAVKGYELKEIRWYASTPSIEDGENMYYRHMAFLSELQKKGIRVITRKLQKISNKDLIKRKKELINSLDLCKDCKQIVEASFIDLADIRKKEKGIDVWIAIDIVKESLITQECEACILISGDADFIPALDLVNKEGIEILNASVPFGFSSELRTKYPYFIIRKETIMKCLKSYN